MSKFWTIVQHEYKRHVLRKRFLFGLLSVPSIVVVMIVVMIRVLMTRVIDSDSETFGKSQFLIGAISFQKNRHSNAND